MHIIVGLGNPGSRYEPTRHNVGFRTVDLLSERFNIPVKRLKWKALTGEGRIGSHKVLLVKPQTFMNKSGESVMEIMNYYGVPIEKLIVITDDIDIQFGRIRIRKGGSAGTHNGLKSIIYLLKDDGFPRIKVAVGPKNPHMNLADFVLSRFSSEEQAVVDREIEAAADAVETIVRKGMDEAMNIYNPLDFLEGK